MAIAESGRVIVNFEGSTMNSKTVIPEHLHWQESLNSFWYGFLSHSFTPNAEGIDPIPQLEPKDTMLSFPIANRREKGGEFLYSYEAGRYAETVFLSLYFLFLLLGLTQMYNFLDKRF